jgi:hypothetical protein
MKDETKKDKTKQKEIKRSEYLTNTKIQHQKIFSNKPPKYPLRRNDETNLNTR